MHEDITLEPFSDGKVPDIRKHVAERFYAKYKEGVYAVAKAPRAGATAGYISAAIDRKERILVIEPNGNIAEDTVSNVSVSYSNNKDADMVIIPSNHKCLKNEMLCEEYPDVRRLRVIPLPEKCDDCADYEQCPVTAIVRKKKTLSGAVMTYHKLAAIMLAPKFSKDHETVPLPKQIADIIRGFKITLLDEAHFLQGVTNVRLDTMWPDAGKAFKPDKYDAIEEAYPEIYKFAEAFKYILNHEAYLKAAERLAAQVRDRPKDKHLRELIDNPALLVPKYDDTMALFNGLVDLMINRKKYKLSVSSVVELSDIYHIVTSPKLSIGGKMERNRRREGAVISITGVDADFVRMVKEYFKDMDTRKHRVIITSATLGSMDFSEFFNKYTKVHKLMYGKGGDPLNANKKVLFISDSRRLRHYQHSRRRMLEMEYEICPVIVDAIEAVGVDGVMITAMNKWMAEELQDILLCRYGKKIEVNYFRSKISMGVEQKARLHIVINAAHIPVNTFDPICDTLEESRKRREEMIQSDTYQAMTRAKDPAGKEPSAIMCIYCTPEDVARLTTWGHDRVLEKNRDTVGSTGFDYEVYCGEYVNDCKFDTSNGLCDMLNKALNHLGTYSKAPVDDKSKEPTEDEKHEDGTGIDWWAKRSSEENAEETLAPFTTSETNPDGESKMNPICNNTYRGQNQLSVRIFEDDDKHSLHTDEEIVVSVEKSKPAVSPNVVNSKPSLLSEILEMRTGRNPIPAFVQYPLSDVKYTAESMAEYREHFEDQAANYIRRENPRTFTTANSLLRGCIVSRLDYRYTQQDDGTYKGSRHDPVLVEKTIDNWITSHIQGVTTIGMPCLDKHADGIWGCIDIDAHRKQTDTGVEFIKRKFNASVSGTLIQDYLKKLNIEPLIEESGSPGSYHIWVFFNRASGVLIKYVMTAITLCAGVDYKALKIEINPKQANHSAMKRAGNQVKMPFAHHRLYKGVVSKVWNAYAGEIQDADTFTPLPIIRLDISGVDTMDEKVLVTVKEVERKIKMQKESMVVDEDGTVWYNADVTDVNTGGRMQKFYEWALKQDLCGSDGHMLRVYSARYYLNQGLTAEEVTKLFSTQSDYSEEYSLKQVRHLASVKCGYIKYDTLRENCSAFVERFEEETGMQIARNAGGGTASSPASCF